MLDVVMRLAAADFRKSERSLDVPAEFLDVYVVQDLGLRLYVKFGRDESGFYKLISFHEA